MLFSLRTGNLKEKDKFHFVALVFRAPEASYRASKD